VIRGRIWSWSASYQPTIRGQIMQRLTSAQLFGAPKSARKTKARLARAKLLIVAARERAQVMAQRYAAQPSTIPLMRRRKKPRFPV
jgi:hypothetical protein